MPPTEARTFQALWWLLRLSFLTAIGAFALTAVSIGGILLPDGKPADAQEPTPPLQPAGTEGTDVWCLSCHSNPDLEMRFPNGDLLPLAIDAEQFRHSVHGNRLTCADCHQRNLTVPHDSPSVEGRRQLAMVEYEACKRCHFDNYTRTLDSMHFDALAQGKENAPICTDCHDAHAMERLTESRTSVAQTCSKCHKEEFYQYSSSVHGLELTEKDNPDVPVCITCHGVHNIGGAKTASFRQASVGLCAGCHSDKELMAEYDISPNVFTTYLDDFHGKTVGFYQEEGSEVWPDVAVCTDCHGEHDIAEVDDADSSVFKENLVETCRKCHKDAAPGFSAAWLSHYEPSLSRAPLVYLIKQYYRFLIPAMMVGLALNIMLDLWRLARNR